MGFKVDVTITNPDGQTATLSGAVEFNPAPSIQSILPASGPASGGSQHVITGANFMPGVKVLFGTRPAVSVVVSADGKSITVVAPAML